MATPSISQSGETAPQQPARRPSRIALVGVLATIVAALAAVLALWQADGSASQSVNVSGNGRADCSNLGDNSTCNSTTVYEDASDLDSDEDFKAEIAEASTAPPSGEGPWMFTVVDTDGLGLKVRDDPGREGRQIGTAANREPVWATCQVRNDFDPEPHTGVGPVWLKIGWPSDTPGPDFSGSQITDPPQGWVYRAYVVPVGHNGDIPDC